MPYDIETDNNVIELIPGQKIKADHIYINDVDIDTLTETVAMLDKKVNAINHKLDKIIGALTNDNAIVCSKDDTGRWNCHVNIDNSIQEDEPLGI